MIISMLLKMTAFSKTKHPLQTAPLQNLGFTAIKIYETGGDSFIITGETARN